MWYLRRDNQIARTDNPQQVLRYVENGWHFITRKEFERLKPKPAPPKKLPFRMGLDVRRKIQEEARKLAKPDDPA